MAEHEMMLETLLRTWAKKNDSKYYSWLRALLNSGIDDLDDLKAESNNPQGWKAFYGLAS